MYRRANNIILLGTGNTVGTLDATEDEITLTASGTYHITASQWFYIEVQTTTGFTMGAAPALYPPETIIEIIASTGNKYVQIKRYDIDGIYVVNKVGV